MCPVRPCDLLLGGPGRGVKQLVEQWPCLFVSPLLRVELRSEPERGRIHLLRFECSSNPGTSLIGVADHPGHLSQSQVQAILGKGFAGRLKSAPCLFNFLGLHEILDISEPGLGHGGVEFHRSFEASPSLCFLARIQIESAQGQVLGVVA